MKAFTRLIQCFIILSPIILFGALVYRFLVPSGVFEVVYEIGDASSFIDRLLPDQRVKTPTKNVQGEFAQQLIRDPVFFFVHPHRAFQEIAFDIWFQNTGVPIVEFGALGGVAPERYTLQPLQNLLIDGSNWHRIEQQGMILLQRNKTYESLSDFFAHPPRRDEIALYNASFPVSFRFAEYQPSNRSRSFSVALVGHHEFKTYLKDETLSFDFAYTDVNQEIGADPISIVVFDEQGVPVAESRQDDDENQTDNGIASDTKTVAVLQNGLPEGVYRMVVNASRDILIHSIQTSQQKFIVMNELTLDALASLWTDAKQLKAKTRSANGVQTISFGSEELAIEEPYRSYEMQSREIGLLPIQIPKSDLELFFDGAVSFSEESFFQPDPVLLTHTTDVDARGIHYLLASYEPPQTIGDWFMKTVRFKTEGLVSDDRTWKFVFSIPGVNETDKTFFVHQLIARFFRKPLWPFD